MRAYMPMIENQDINALTGNGQGLAISNDFCLRFDPAPQPTNVAQQAALYQNSPHAIADPAWMAKTEVWGRFLPVDEKRFPKIEFCLDAGYRQNTTTPEICEEYGMWIWPDTHNNWSVITGESQWHRFWNLSHYQNVWESWLLYIRGGKPWTLEWARRNSRHYMDVGTVNYDDPRFPLLGHIAGSMYHTKGFTPWGSPRDLQEAGDDYVEVGAHFTNANVFVTEWQLMGDRTGKELMETWGRALGRVAMPPERSRENNNTLAELLEYYTATWDPDALVHMTDLADEMFSRPWVEIPAASGHAVFNAQWVRRQWEHTRDPRMKEYAIAYMDAVPEAYSQVAGQAYQWTGDKKYFAAHLPGLSTTWQRHYDNPDDPLHGYGPRLGHLGSGALAQKAPYFMQALVDAGIESLPTDESTAGTIAKVQTVKPNDSIAYLRAQPYPYGQYVAYIQPRGDSPSATLKFDGLVMDNDGLLRKKADTTYIRVEDAAGKVLLETTILAGSKRPSATVTLDAKSGQAPFKLYKSGWDATITWTGPATELTLGPTPESVK
jgi:hypothetical protein